jgi:hypothetical protein
MMVLGLGLHDQAAMLG